MARPDKLDFTGASVTEGGFKIAHDQLIDWLDTLLGAVDDYLDLVSGTDASRPAATGSGWLRYNTDNNSIDVTVSSVWKKLMISAIDATWSCLVEATVATIIKFKTTNVEGRLEVECASAGNAGFGTDADEIFIKSTGTKPVRIWINGTPVFKLDSSGNLIVTGNVTANGTV